MIKLTRLNNNTVAINPDHISWIDVLPDTTLSLMSGERIIVRESLDVLIERHIEYRRQCRSLEPGVCSLGRSEGDPPTLFPTRAQKSQMRSSVRPSAEPGHISNRPPPPFKSSEDE